MRKLLIGLMFLLSSQVNAQDLITSTLLDHVMTVTQFKSGETNIALMDSVVQIGSRNGKSIFDLQAGFSGNTKPTGTEANAANFLFGGFLKVSSLFGDKVKFPPHWEFLNSIEHGVTYLYDSREKKDFISYQVGLAFDLNPK